MFNFNKSVSRLGIINSDVSHTRKGPGIPTSFQGPGYKRPGKVAAKKRLRKLTGGNHSTGR